MAKQIPLRQCIGCRQMKPKNELVRVIKTPDEQVCLDKTGKMNGRGAYICLNSECYNKAVKSKGIERALKIAIPEEIYQAIGKELM
ncbi:MAG: YlxR family protein [Lachnospiraceae bacterium]|nr:YlxR family protein [Lachnospiraceae bacterium]